MTTPRVLIVDDEPSVLDVCSRVLRGGGFEVIAASNAQMARVLLRAHMVDLLITDVRMPQESGIALLETVREVSPELPLMIITGYPDPPAFDAAVNLNVRSLLVKPFFPEQLLSEARRSLGMLPADDDGSLVPAIADWLPAILEELRQHDVPVIDGVIERDPRDGRVVLTPGSADSAVPLDEFLSEYTQGEHVYLVLLPYVQPDRQAP